MSQVAGGVSYIFFFSKKREHVLIEHGWQTKKRELEEHFRKTDITPSEFIKKYDEYEASRPWWYQPKLNLKTATKNGTIKP